MAVLTEATSTGRRRAQPRLRDAVEALSAIERRATTAGERRSAEWVAEQLREAGAEDVRLTEYRAHSTWALATSAHALLALVASAGRGWIARALTLATLVSFEADSTGRSMWLRSLLPGKRRGTNVEAHLPSDGPRRRTVVLVAHHDAAHSGFVWHPAMLEAGRARARKTGMTPSYSSLPMGAMIALAVGGAPLRMLARAILGTGIALSVQAARSQTVAGANDNASGVAGLLELTRTLAANPIAGLETIVLCPGGEEAGGVGIAGWLSRRRRELDPATTLFVGLDSIGSGDPVVSVRESATGRYRSRDVELVDRAADRAGLARPRRIGLGAVSDPMIARNRGFRSISLLSWRDGGIANLHRPTDVAENVDWSSAERVTQLAGAVIEEWSDA